MKATSHPTLGLEQGRRNNRVLPVPSPVDNCRGRDLGERAGHPDMPHISTGILELFPGLSRP